jgi:hypothetical protein
MPRSILLQRFAPAFSNQNIHREYLPGAGRLTKRLLQVLTSGILKLKSSLQDLAESILGQKWPLQDLAKGILNLKWPLQELAEGICTKK